MLRSSRAAASLLRVQRRAVHASRPLCFLPDSEIDQLLRRDVKALGSMVGECIKNENQHDFDSVEKLRKLGRHWRPNNVEAFNEMVDAVKTYQPARLLRVAKSFAHFLALTNSAENHHRIRRLRNALDGAQSPYGFWPKEDSCAGSIQHLTKDLKISKDEVFRALTTQQVDVVFTAHPTEVNRRTMLRKQLNIRRILEQLDRADISLFERRKLKSEMRAQVLSVWNSDTLRRSKPTPVDEARYGFAIVENCLWDAVPAFLRKLDDLMLSELDGKRLPLQCSPVRLSSWMGGDRDGNPNVTPEITYEVSMLSRWMAATLYKQDLHDLRSSLSMQRCSEEFRALVPDSREPYREYLRQLDVRLQRTIDWSFAVATAEDKSTMVPPPPGTLTSSADLMQPLLAIHRSLVHCGHESIADTELADILRRVATFGVALMPMDIRQESSRHSEALNAITRFMGIGSYLEWDEDTRRAWLQKELSKSRRPLLPRNANFAQLGFSPTVIDTLKTFQVAAAIHTESLGAYVISQCQQASDVLAVALLQQDAGVYPPMRVVPLFETLDDLQRAPATVDALLGMPSYKGMTNGVQEIMVGYSDSAKDAGRIAAAWEQFNSQVAMAEIAKNHNIAVTFFHGKGGTVGRGGNPAIFQAILAHPPHTIHGRFRVTEQGEMITQNFGEVAVAERTLDLLTAGVLTERFCDRPIVKPEWKDAMNRMADVSCETYRNVVRNEPRFVPYFRSATPEMELARLNVGSRPSKRNPTGGVESLRAIPWNFAWTQTRLNLPTWLGVGEAFAAEQRDHPQLLQEMYDQWPWFQTMVDLVEMILAMSEPMIAENYDKQLVANDADSAAIGAELRQKLLATTKQVMDVSRHNQLEINNPVLLRSLAVRNPYIDPLNILQAEILKRLRESEVSSEDRAVLQDALLLTINGIANGMKNSG